MASKFLNKQIPTIIGLLLLVVALGAGVVFLRVGPGILTPRATPQTTPKNIKITNVTDSTVTISFITDEQTTGFVKYGNSANSLSNQASDDRDQLSGNVGTYNTHHITLRNLQPTTTYYFVLGTASNEFDNNGSPYSVETSSRVSGSTNAQTIYGNVLNPDSSPADGAIVYLAVEGAGELSSLVRSSGTWAIPLVQLRGAEGGSPPTVSAATPMRVFAQGDSDNETATLVTTVGQPQFPVKTITLGVDGESQQADNTGSGTNFSPEFSASESATVTLEPTATATPTPISTDSITPTASPSVTASVSATPTLTASATATLTPTFTPTSTPTPASSQPATDSPQPVSGSVGYTLMLIMTGILVTSIGGVLLLVVAPSKRR